MTWMFVHVYLELKETFFLTGSNFSVITDICAIANLFGVVWLQYWIT